MPLGAIQLSAASHHGAIPRPPQGNLDERKLWMDEGQAGIYRFVRRISTVKRIIKGLVVIDRPTLGLSGTQYTYRSSMIIRDISSVMGPRLQVVTPSRIACFIRWRGCVADSRTKFARPFTVSIS